MSDFTTFLFAIPTIASGLARLVDFGGTFDSYNVSETPAEADQSALARDWQAVGVDMREAVGAVAQEVS